MAGTSVFVLLILGVCTVRQSTAFFGRQKDDRVLLRDVGAITLQDGHMTTGRRSSPVPQLSCLGGCNVGFRPKVVQCRNAGWDGKDVQWECRADMDSSYRFGHIAVSCEGYDYPDDPYILAGSCGLKYSIELTAEGERRSGRGYDSGYYGGYSHGYHQSYQQQSSSNVGSLTLLVIVALIAYGVYRFRNMTETDHDDEDQSSPQNTDSSSESWKSYGNSSQPRPRFQRTAQSQPYTSPSSSGNGFWTGAAAGGLLGYLFGRNNGYNSGYGYRPHYGHGYGGHGYGHRGGGFFSSGFGSGWSSGGGWSSGDGWSTGGGWSSSSNHSSSSHSSRSRTASGFGGTERR